MSAGLVLVTGAAGFAGGHLLDRLTASGTSVVGWHRPGRQAPAAWPTVRWEAVDLLDRARVARRITDLKPVAVYHVAGAARVDTAWNTVVPHMQINVMATHHVLDAVQQHVPMSRLLVVSSGLVYRPSTEPLTEDSPMVPANPYGLSKLAQDQLALHTAIHDGLDVVVARPFNHIGPRQEPAFSVASFARQIALAEAGLAEPTIRVGNLDTARDITDVRDVAAAYESLMHGGAGASAYNICSERAMRIGDLLDELLRHATIRVHVETDPNRMRTADIPVVLGSAERIRQTVGWSPRYPLGQTLLDTLNWWRASLPA